SIISFECLSTGRFEMSSFHELFGGKICVAARILSASGVLNITGAVIFGIGGNDRPVECLPDSCVRGTVTTTKSSDDSGTTNRFMRASEGAGAKARRASGESRIFEDAASGVKQETGDSGSLTEFSRFAGRATDAIESRDRRAEPAIGLSPVHGAWRRSRV